MNNLDISKIAEGIKQLENNIDNNINLELIDEIPHESFTDPRLDKSDNGKSRVWVMLLYPDNEYHAKILETVFTDFVSVGALHDNDYSKDGKKTKDHYHIVLYFTSPVYKTHITSKYGFYDKISDFVHKRSDVKKQVRYLLHADTPSKHQYPATYLEGNTERFQKYFDKDGYEASELVTIINMARSDEFPTLADFVIFICENNLYATYRRNAYTVNMIYGSYHNPRKE